MIPTRVYKPLIEVTEECERCLKIDYVLCPHPDCSVHGGESLLGIKSRKAYICKENTLVGQEREIVELVRKARAEREEGRYLNPKCEILVPYPDCESHGKSLMRESKCGIINS